MTDDPNRDSEGPLVNWAARVLIDLVSDQALEEAELPHILICRALDTGYVTYSGPYLTAMDAMVAADYEEGLAANDTEIDLEFSVAPIYRALPIP
jgi:hypothetical protein